jgi:hypothetical protein
MNCFKEAFVSWKNFSTTGLSPSLVQDSAASLKFFSKKGNKMFSHNPNVKHWFRLFPVRSPLLRESLLLSFPSATKMFQFAELPLSCL